jgi:hypothetical protein
VSICEPADIRRVADGAGDQDSRIATTVTMAPIAIPIHESIPEKDTVQPIKDTLGLPESARKRLEKAGIDLSNGYPYRPAKVRAISIGILKRVNC